MALDFDTLRQSIETATKEAFAEMVAKHGQEGIYAFALYSDEGAMTVCPATNTRQHLAKADPDYYAESKFEPAEWAYEMAGAEERFDTISEALSNEVLNLSDDDSFIIFQKHLYVTCIDVLEKLNEENFFSELAGNDVFLLFSVSDYEFDKEERAQTVTKLNGNPYRDEYIAWLATWSDQHP